MATYEIQVKASKPQKAMKFRLEVPYSSDGFLSSVMVELSRRRMPITTCSPWSVREWLVMLRYNRVTALIYALDIKSSSTPQAIRDARWTAQRSTISEHRMIPRQRLPSWHQDDRSSGSQRMSLRTLFVATLTLSR